MEMRPERHLRRTPRASCQSPAKTFRRMPDGNRVYDTCAQEAPAARRRPRMSTRPTRFIDDYLLLPALARASHAVYKGIERTVNANGLTSLEWRARHLSDGGALPVGELAREVIVGQPTLTKLVQRMGRQAGGGAHGTSPTPAAPGGGGHRARSRCGCSGSHAPQRRTKPRCWAASDRTEVETLQRILRALIERADD